MYLVRCGCARELADTPIVSVHASEEEAGRFLEWVNGGSGAMPFHFMEEASLDDIHEVAEMLATCLDQGQ